MNLSVGRSTPSPIVPQARPQSQVSQTQETVQTPTPPPSKESFDAARQSPVGKSSQAVSPSQGMQMLKQGIDTTDSGVVAEQGQMLMESPVLSKEFGIPAPPATLPPPPPPPPLAPSSSPPTSGGSSITADMLTAGRQQLKQVSQHQVLNLDETGGLDKTVAESGRSIKLGQGGSVFAPERLTSEATLEIVGHGSADGSKIGGMSPQQLAKTLKDAGIQQLNTLHLKSCRSSAFAQELSKELRLAGIQIHNIHGFEGAIAIDKNSGKTLIEQNGVILDHISGHSGKLGLEEAVNFAMKLKPAQIDYLIKDLSSGNVERVFENLSKSPLENIVTLTKELFPKGTPEFSPELGPPQEFAKRIKSLKVNMDRFSEVRWSHPSAQLFDACKSPAALCEEPLIEMSNRAMMFSQALDKSMIGLSEHPAARHILEGMRNYTGMGTAKELVKQAYFALTPCELGETYYICAAHVLCDESPAIYRVPNSPGAQDVSARQMGLVGEVFPLTRRGDEPFPNLEESRPRGNAFAKADINAILLAPFFLANGPILTATTIRERFLASADPNPTMDFLSTKGVSLDNSVPRVAIWLSNKEGEYLNLGEKLPQIIDEVRKAGIREVIFVGDDPGSHADKRKGKQTQVAMERAMQTLPCHNLIGFYKPLGSLSNQLMMFDTLYRQGGLVCNIGNKSGAMDGPSLIGVPQIFIETTHPDRGPVTRMGLTSMCSPFWQQVCTNAADLTPDAIGMKIVICRETRDWHFKNEAEVVGMQGSHSGDS